MACLIGRRVVNPHYKKIAPYSHYKLYNDRDGIYPKPDYYINVDCGRCINCFRKYMSAWRFRLIHELTSLSKAERQKTYFVTLTIEHKFYTEKKSKLKIMVRRFLERVRKKYGKSVRHFLVTERGDTTNRLHFHGFFINTDVPPNDFYNLWYYGFVKIAGVDSDPNRPLSQRISYCTSYVTKGKKGVISNVIPPENWPLVLVSAGLGKQYVEQNRHIHINQSVLFPLAFDVTGKVRSLPRYLRLKVFDEQQLKSLKDDYFANQSEDVIPDPPYFIGNKQFVDYIAYLRECELIKLEYLSIYGK